MIGREWHSSAGFRFSASIWALAPWAKGDGAAQPVGSNRCFGGNPASRDDALGRPWLMCAVGVPTARSRTLRQYAPFRPDKHVACIATGAHCIETELATGCSHLIPAPRADPPTTEQPGNRIGCSHLPSPASRPSSRRRQDSHLCRTSVVRCASVLRVV